MMAFPVRRRLWVVLILTVSLFLVYSAVGERGFIRMNSMAQQRDELRTKVSDLKESNARLAEQIGRLRDDPVTIEHLARTELGMVRDGETVYILSDRPGEQIQ